MTARSLLFGTCLVAAISVLSPWAILVVKGSQLTSNAIPIIAIFLLFLVTVVLQPILRWLGDRGAFTRPELITIYVMMLVGSVVVTTGFAGTFLSVITGAVYYATPENDWNSLFVPYLSRWLTPDDTQAIRLFYEGLPKGQVIPWESWVRPLVTWISFILVFYWTLFCIGVILRGQWVENERLVFPLTRLPLAMVEEPAKGSEGERSLVARLFTNRVMWMGFAIPLLIHSWNSLGNYSDAFQKLPLSGTMALLPGLVTVPVRLNLPVLGLAYLMPLNVAFSVWFFFAIGVLQTLIFARLGIQIGTGDVWNSGGGAPSILHQSAGGMMVFVLFLLWTARSHIRGLWRQARGQQAIDGREVLSPRLAFGGLAMGYLFLLAWLTASGLSPYVAFLLLTGALGAFIGLSRVVAEAGLPSCQTPM
ncbi:MAG: hypothetical protein HOB49_16705, partial [Gemmatimonadetes bacterium]|nr:hypothetical protein [Gemmatimonadota bacterium]